MLATAFLASACTGSAESDREIVIEGSDFGVKSLGVDGWTTAEGASAGVGLYSDDGYCSALFSAVYEPSYRAGRGDEYLSKETLYSTTVLSIVPPSAAREVEVTSATEGEVIALFAIDFAYENIVQDAETEEQYVDGIVYTTSFVRTFDVLVDIPPDQIDSGTYVAYETDSSKGLPSVVGTIQCLDEPLGDDEMGEILNSLSILGATTTP